MKLKFLWLIPVIGFSLDQIIKIITVLQPDGFFVFYGPLGFSRFLNRGVAFSLALPWLVIVASTIIILGYLIAWAVRLRRRLDQRYLFVLLVIAGGASNLVDRLISGAVIDYFIISWWWQSAFNLADVMIIFGIGSLLVTSWRSQITVLEAKELNDLNRKTYERIAPDFAVSRQKPVPPEFMRWQRYLKDGVKVVDLGAGSGRLLPIFTKFSLDYTGVDNCPALLATARERLTRLSPAAGSHYNFQVSDIINLPFPDASFDVVVMAASLHHLAPCQQRAALAEARRVLKKSGQLLISVFNLWRWSWRDKTIWQYYLRSSRHAKQVVGAATRRHFGPKDIILWWNSQPLYYYAFTRGELKSLAKTAGFDIQQAGLCEGKRNLVLVCKK